MVHPPESARTATRSGVRRIDLHCHSEASQDGAEVVLDAIGCPECFSRPADVYAQATRRSMDFVTITDHDTILGVQQIADRSNVLVGEELTCWFPEDHCKMHVLVWGITPSQHDELQSAAADIYAVSDYLETNNIAHAVAHPLYRQNEILERWHVERLVLLFKGFECLNGSHSGLHRDVFEPFLDALTPERIDELSADHNVKPRWPEPWVKSRTAGSDDHGLLNVGRTWTEFPADAATVDDLLRCLREGNCRPGGEAGTSAKLAHAFYSVGVKYYARRMLTRRGRPNLAATLMQAIVGERRLPSNARLAAQVVRHKISKLGGRIVRPFSKSDGGAVSGLAGRLFMKSAWRRLGGSPVLIEALRRGLPPLGEHESMFRLVTGIDRDVTRGIAAAAQASIATGKFTGIFDAFAAAVAQQFTLLPYYFTLFHQNKERHLLGRLVGRECAPTSQNFRVGLFTDSLDEYNGVGQFVRAMGSQGHRLGRSLVVHTCCAEPSCDEPWRKNFVPVLSRPMPYRPSLSLTLPPVLEILEWADRQQFDVIHVSTPGPMGIVGWLVAKMLRVPLVGTYHTDLPSLAEQLTDDHRVAEAAGAFVRWLYGGMSFVLTQSRSYLESLESRGVPQEKAVKLPPCVDTTTFNPHRRDQGLWERHRVREPRRLLFTGPLVPGHGLELLVDIFRRVCAQRGDIALVIAGDGADRLKVRHALRGLPAYFLGPRADQELAPLYASSDLLIFPSPRESAGQAALEAAASGLPAIVAAEGAAAETVADGITGRVLREVDAAAWAKEILALLNDEPLRQRMSRAAAVRAVRYTMDQTFESFWGRHLAAAAAQAEHSVPPSRPLAAAQGLSM